MLLPCSTVASFRGEFEERLKAVLKEIKDADGNLGSFPPDGIRIVHIGYILGFKIRLGARTTHTSGRVEQVDPPYLDYHNHDFVGS